jgi:C-terminal processing protease CtpA/Prc
VCARCARPALLRSAACGAALAADALLDGGLLWRRDAGGRLREYKADRDCLLRDVPMVVLIDSTSGGEAVPLLAAALQDNTPS